VHDFLAGYEVFNGGLEGGGYLDGFVGTGKDFAGFPGGECGLLYIGFEDYRKVLFCKFFVAFPEVSRVVLGHSLIIGLGKRGLAGLALFMVREYNIMV
jgi:hypothetical protein